MFPFIKLLKIVLPVTTVTAATIATVSLVSFKKDDTKLSKEAKDKVLEDFERPVEDFKERIMLYSEDGQEESVSVDSKDLEKILKAKEENKLSDKDSGPKSQNDLDTPPKDPVKSPQEDKGVQNDTNSSDEPSLPLVSVPEVDEKTPEGGAQAPTVAEEKGGETGNQNDEESKQNSLDKQGQEEHKKDLDSPQPSVDSEMGEENSVKANIQEPSDGVNDSSEPNDISAKTKDQIIPEDEGKSDEDQIGTKEDSPSEQKDEGDSQSSLGGESSKNQDGSSDIGSSDSISGGQEDGKEPITEEQLKRFKEIESEASTALDSLKKLLGDSFQI
ncbi:hypothetical protein A6V39_01090 [Candidatus Mycoplasma haematobovis]|uniref:Uncharacterized protein n=1 Tax=Candidatus Mycoplasma haematobovis TaxID=432608 RepID=A0A1A9QEI0_9MOLU|nr:hypothetical protein [Candidatus Mycoplasma haematobovis]OAL10648.1 hypothetical protein A6V39_01090 [Candidatus Mycoplasma haematobovis]